MLSRSQRTAFKAEQINDAVVLEHFPAKWNPVSRKEMLLTKPASTFA